MIYIAICDDQVAARNRADELITETLNDWNFDFKTVCVESGKALLALLEQRKVDIIFLDIFLGDINGTEVGEYIHRKLKHHNTKIICMTSLKSPSTEIVRTIHPMDFITKPVERENIVMALQVAIEYIDLQNDIFQYKANKQIQYIALKEIIYFKAKGKKVLIVTEKQTIEFIGTLKEIISESFYGFIAISRDTIINFERVNKPMLKQMIMDNGEILKISSRKQIEVRNSVTKLVKQRIMRGV